MTRGRRGQVLNQKLPTARSIRTSTICGTRAAHDCSRLAGPCITCSTCSAMRRSSRQAPTSMRRFEDCTNRCGRSINPAPLANRLQTDPPPASGLFASRLPPETGTPLFTDCCSWRGPQRADCARWGALAGSTGLVPIDAPRARHVPEIVDPDKDRAKRGNWRGRRDSNPRPPA